MNYEHNPDHATGATDPDYEPRHGEEAPRSPQGDAIINHLAQQAPTAQAASRLRDAYRRHGTAYAIFLTLDDVDRYGDTTEADFQNSYHAVYPDRTGLVTDTIASFGWQHNLNQRLGDDPLLHAVVGFDHEAIWGFVNDHFQVIETGDEVHVFDRWPSPRHPPSARQYRRERPRRGHSARVRPAAPLGLRTGPIRAAHGDRARHGPTTRPTTEAARHQSYRPSGDP